jgi:ribosomal protein S18 acetylase RimI-like enzyme
MSDYRIVTVDSSNVEEQGFFCYKSKKKSEGYQNKLNWLRSRLAEGMVIKILYQGDRSVGFIEYTPAEYAWRVVHAPHHTVIHCLWVVGRGKGKGYGSRLLQECEVDARAADMQGIVMVSSKSVWLAGKGVFLKNGFERIAQAPPTFDLLVKPLRDGPSPSLPDDWTARAAAFGSGMTVLYTDQCPYIPDAVRQAREAFETRGIETRAIKLESSEEVQQRAPSAYGVFNVVYNGELFSYHYLGKREIARLDEMLA